MRFEILEAQLMKNRSIWTILISLLVSIALAVMPTPAKAITRNCSGLDHLSEETSSRAIAEMTALLEESLRGGAIDTVSSRAELDFENSRALVSKKNEEVEFRTLSIPIDGLEIPSNLTAVYGVDGNLFTYSETLVSQVSENVYRVQIINDGQLTTDRNVDISAISESDLQQELIQATRGGGGPGAVAGCLAGLLGIGGITAWAIAISCGGACTVPTPITAPICAACIGAYAVLGGASMGAIAACFQLV